MKIRIAAANRFFSITVLVLFLGTALSAFAQSGGLSLNTSPLPAPTAPVNDYAGVIDAGTLASLNQKLIDFKTKSGVEMAVAVVKTTDDRPIFDYSLAVARGWGIGSKADDNPSALLFIAIDDRKYFTQVSKDLEDELPDGIVGSLQRQYLVPEFKKQNYTKGISDTIDAYIQRIEAQRSGLGTPTPDQGEFGSEAAVPSLFGILCCLGIFLFILVILLSSRNGGGGGGAAGGGRNRWGGGFGGGAVPWIITTGGGSSDWGGGGWSGGGGGGWGGFGGGGDFGGGGAGGGW